LILGALATLAVVSTLSDPGITVDEPLDVVPGRNYVRYLLASPARFLDRDVVEKTYFDNAEHPPLGRWLLGVASTVGEPFEIWRLGPDPLGDYVIAGRAAPACCFGALVALVATAAARHSGRVAGVAAGIALGFMPRAFAHAHLGALDTFVALFWTLALIAAGRAVASRRPIAAMALAGLLWALALLTKIHGWLLPPVVLAWAFYRLPFRRAVPAVAAWAATGLAGFFAGWPWLWYDTIPRLRAYFGTAGAGRATIQVLYLGTVYPDRAVPWHYPWFYFGATVPVGLLALGLIGTALGLQGYRRDPFPILVLGAIVLLLAVFSTNVPVYDGERLFLPAFPLWAILVGNGFAAAWKWAGPRRSWKAVACAFLLAQGYGIVALHPFGLSYYNALVGGLPGAERRGLELTFWGDAVDRRLLDELARRAQPGESAAMTPTLARWQGARSTPRALFERQRPLILGDQEAEPSADWVVVWRRTAYWNDEARRLVAEGKPVAVRARQGVWLSALYRRDRAGPSENGAGRIERPTGRPYNPFRRK
jgi:4-amino-4-deoxy-L-arabinose transferase-like glycosyltransferase